MLQGLEDSLQTMIAVAEECVKWWCWKGSAVSHGVLEERTDEESGASVGSFISRGKSQDCDPEFDLKDGQMLGPGNLAKMG